MPLFYLQKFRMNRKLSKSFLEEQRLMRLVSQKKLKSFYTKTLSVWVERDLTARLTSFSIFVRDFEI